MKRYLLFPGVLILSLLLCSSSPAFFEPSAKMTMLNQQEAPEEPSFMPVPEASEALDNPSVMPAASMPHASYEHESENISRGPDTPPSPEDSPPSVDTIEIAVETSASPEPAAAQNKITSNLSSKWYENKEKGVKVPILMYHNLIEGNAPGDGLNVSEKVFEDQIQTLKAYGYNAIFFEDLYAHYARGEALPENPIILTFDDGYRSNYTMAYPILVRFGMKACIFTITNAIDGPSYMTAEQIREASASGIIEFHSHTTGHSYTISTASREEIQKDLTDSRARLEDITSRTVNIFCYPYGRYSQRMIDELKAQDYLFAVTTAYGIASKQSNPYLLPRIRVLGTESGKALKEKIEKLTGKKTRFVGVPEPTPTTEPPTQPEELPLEISSKPVTEPEDDAQPESSPDADRSAPPADLDASPTPSPDKTYPSAEPTENETAPESSGAAEP